MKHSALLGFGLLCVTTISHAADVGLGISAFGEKQNIYVPVLLNPTTMLEAHFAYQNSDSESGTNENIELGIGFFKKTAKTEKANIYYGARLSYEEYNSDSTNSSFTYTSSSEAKGFKISPTIGFEYLITEKLSLGAEAEFYYAKFDQDYTQTMFPTTISYSSETEMTGTDTRMVIRYFF